MESEELITEEWLSSVGFKWHQLDRQPEKHWILWLGDAVRDGNSFTSYDDLGINIAANTPANDKWFCWIRSDCGGRFSRFLHIRFIRTQQDVITLCEALTGHAWNPANHLYGAMRTPDQAARLRKDDERLDRLLTIGPLSGKWREIEKDDTIGRPLPEHLEAHEQAKKKESKC